MREILFRGKTDKGEWVQGVPFFEEERCYIIEDLFICDEYDCTGAVNTMVIPETIGQYTGLTDKNGTKIFEGDIVKRTFGEFTRIYQVIFDVELFCFIAKRNNGFSTLDDAFEVIGNIHDNPELIGGADND